MTYCSNIVITISGGNNANWNDSSEQLFWSRTSGSLFHCTTYSQQQCANNMSGDSESGKRSQTATNSSEREKKKHVLFITYHKLRLALAFFILWVTTAEIIWCISRQQQLAFLAGILQFPRASAGQTCSLTQKMWLQRRFCCLQHHPEGDVSVTIRENLARARKMRSSDLTSHPVLVEWPWVPLGAQPHMAGENLLTDALTQVWMEIRHRTVCCLISSHPIHELTHSIETSSTVRTNCSPVRTSSTVHTSLARKQPFHLLQLPIGALKRQKPKVWPTQVSIIAKKNSLLTGRNLKQDLAHKKESAGWVKEEKERESRQRK